MEYTCRHCGSHRVFVRAQGRTMNVHCLECREWIARITYKQALELYKKLAEEDLGDKVAMRRFLKRGGVITVKCSHCNCLLSNSCFPPAQGQFDLSAASYCPRCGKELI